MMTPEEERIERLERALSRLVYHEVSSEHAVDEWRTEFRIDTDVTNIIGDLLDKYKPKDITDP